MSTVEEYMSTPDISLAPRAAASSGPQADPRRWTAMALLALVQFMLTLDSTIVNVALPTIKTNLGFSTHGLAWVVNGYTLAAGGFLIVGGRVADLVGRRRMFMIGTILFAVASTTSGLAQTPAMLVISRFAQGLGEALAAPAALSLVVLPDATERAKAIGAWGGITIIGATLGVVISGVIVDALSWRWVFLVNLPVAAVVLFVVPRMVKESRKEGTRELDLPGALLVTGSLVLIVDGLLNASHHGWGSSAVLVPIAIGAGLSLAFAVTQLTLKHPLIPKTFFQNRTRVSSNLVTIFGAGAFLGMFFTVTLYMQDVSSLQPIESGTRLGAVRARSARRHRRQPADPAEVRHQAWPHVQLHRQRNRACSAQPDRTSRQLSGSPAARHARNGLRARHQLPWRTDRRAARPRTTGRGPRSRGAEHLIAARWKHRTVSACDNRTAPHNQPTRSLRPRAHIRQPTATRSR